MQFGMPTLIELKSLTDCAALCRELGLAFVELNMNFPAYQADRLDTARMREIAERYGIYFTIHLAEDMNPCNFDSRVASAYTETAVRTIAVAKALSVPVVNMHLHAGIQVTLPGRKIFLYEVYEAEYLKLLTAFREACTEAVGGSAVKVCVENCGNYAKLPYLQKALAVLLESPAFMQTFDIGHNAAADFSDEPTILARADRLYHFHIHDAKGSANHLALGDGNMDLAKYLALADAHHCRAVVEVKTVEGLRKSVAWLKENGRI